MVVLLILTGGSYPAAHNTSFYNNAGTINLRGISVTTPENAIYSRGICNIYAGTTLTSTAYCYGLVEIAAGTTNIYGGNISYASGACGDLVAVRQGATLNMSGGTITQPTHLHLGDENWAALVIQGTFNMTGGTVQNTKRGRSLYIIGGTATISNGAVIFTAGNSGIEVGSGSTLYIKGGTIKANSSDILILVCGGGRCVMSAGVVQNTGAGLAVANNGTFNRSGGAIIGSTSGM